MPRQSLPRHHSRRWDAVAREVLAGWIVVIYTPLRRLGWARWLIAAGSIVQIATSVWIHPLAFVVFLLITCPLVVTGMLFFLWAIVTRP
jgi:hypothetical protein